MAEKAVLSNHPINTHLRNILKLFEDDEFREQIRDLDAEARSAVRSIELFARQTTDRIANSSDYEVSQNGLRQVSSNLQNVWNEINAFRTNGQLGHLANASTNLDGELNSAAWTFFNRPPKGSRVYGETVKSVERASEEALQKLKNRASGVASRFTNFENKIDELEGAVGSAEQRLSGLSTDADAALAEIRAEFSAIKAEVEQERQSDREQREVAFKQFFEDQKIAAAKSVEKISEYEAKAKEILQIVGNIGLTGNFKKRSSDETTAANFWRWATIILFALGIGLISFSLVSNIVKESALNLLFIRLAIGVAITLPAIYTARESARHRTNSDQAKQTELELASLTPFIENLPDEEKWKVLSALTHRYFGSVKVTEHKPDLSLPTDGMLGLADKLVERIPKA